MGRSVLFFILLVHNTGTALYSSQNTITEKQVDIIIIIKTIPLIIIQYLRIIMWYSQLNSYMLTHYLVLNVQESENIGQRFEENHDINQMLVCSVDKAYTYAAV